MCLLRHPLLFAAIAGLASAAMVPLERFAALAADKPVIAVVAPKTGTFEVLGRQIRLGVALAGQDRATIVEIDESCEDGSGEAIGTAIIESGARVAIGFLCSASLEGSLPALKETGIAALSVAVRAPTLLADAASKDWPLFTLAPSLEAERDGLAKAAIELFGTRPFAILDDGQINHHDTAEAVRTALEDSGHAPKLVDAFRPAQDSQTQLLKLLAKAGIADALVIGERSDLAVIARDAKASDRPLTLLGGEATDAADIDQPLEAGTYAVTLSARDGIGIEGLEKSPLAGPDTRVEGYVAPAHAAMIAALEAHDIAAASGATIAEALIDTPFQTVLGTLAFGDDRRLKGNPYRLMRWTGTGFEPVVTVPGG